MQRHHFELHQYFGAAFGFILLLLSLSGSMAVYKNELALWVAGPDRSACRGQVIPQAVLAQSADPKVRRLTLPGYESSFYQLKYRDGSLLQFDRCGAPAAHNGQLLSTFLVELHTRFFLGHEGRWVIGFFAIAMLLSLVSGLLSLKQPWRRYLQKNQPQKEGRSKWALWHKRLGLMSVPALALFALTGIWLGLYGLIIPAASLWSSAAAPNMMASNRSPIAVPAIAAGQSPHGYVLELSAKHFPQLSPVFIEQQFNGKNLTKLSVWGDNPGALVQRHRSGVEYDLQRSVLTLHDPRLDGVLTRIELMIMPLHFGDWGNAGATSLLVKAVYVLLGVLCYAIMLAGLWLWAFRRQRYAGALSGPSSMPGRLTFAVGAAFLLMLQASPLLAKCLLLLPSLSFTAAFVKGWSAQSLFYAMLVTGLCLLTSSMLLLRRPMLVAAWGLLLVTLLSMVVGVRDLGWWHGFHGWLAVMAVVAATLLWRCHRQRLAAGNPVFLASTSGELR